jgi:hypothetical protein
LESYRFKTDTTPLRSDWNVRLLRGHGTNAFDYGTHTAPGLGGGLILPKSSCDVCRQITQKIEELYLRKMLLPYRLRAGLVQHLHEIPEETEVWVEHQNKSVKRNIPRTYLPDFLLVPVLSQYPGILTGNPPGAQIPYHFQLVVNREEMSRVAASLGGSQVASPCPYRHYPTESSLARLDVIARLVEPADSQTMLRLDTKSDASVSLTISGGKIWIETV